MPFYREAVVIKTREYLFWVSASTLRGRLDYRQLPLAVETLLNLAKTEGPCKRRAASVIATHAPDVISFDAPSDVEPA